VEEGRRRREQRKERDTKTTFRFGTAKRADSKERLLNSYQPIPAQSLIHSTGS